MNAKKKLATIMGCLLAAVAFAGCMPYSTGPTEVGVRTVKWSLTAEEGIEQESYNPGSTYWFVPILTDWHTFDTRLQILDMTAAVGRGDRRGPDDLPFKSIDGNDISLDLIISYRIDPDAAPMILQKVATSDEDLKECIVRTITRSKPRDLFGELQTEDFYIADERTQKSAEVVAELNEILRPYGVIIERVGTRDYRFNSDYQAAIEMKKVADQEVEKLKAETRATEEEYRTAVEKAKAEAEKVKAQADGEYERSVIETDAYYEQQQRLAEAILAEGRAAAEGIRKMNEALAGQGGEAIVKLEIARALTGKRIVMLPTGGGGLDVRNTDINALLELFGVQRLSQGTASSPRELRGRTTIR